MEKTDYRPQDEPRCLSCEAEFFGNVVAIPEPAERVDISPSELVFYYMLDSEPPFEPGHVVITNLTPERVDILSADIIDVNDHTYCNGSDFFELEEERVPAMLDPKEKMEIAVIFKWTTRQQAANLVVKTSHLNSPELVVELYGKVFQIGSQ